MHRINVSKLLLFLFTVTTFSSTTFATTVQDNFDSHQLKDPNGEPIAGKANWHDSAFGKDLAIVKNADQNQVLTAPAGGDHHALWQPNRKELQTILNQPVWCLEFDYRGTFKLTIGHVSKWRSRGLVLDGNRNLAIILPDKQLHLGLGTLPKEWHRVRLIAINDINTGRCQLTLSARNLATPNAPFKTEKTIVDIPLALSKPAYKGWNGIAIRLDSHAQLDNLKLYGLNRAGDLPEPVITEIKPSFKADLTRISPPRTAQDLCGIWQYLPVQSPTARPAKNASWQPILVPGQHQALFRSARHGRIWFRTTFNAPVLTNNQNLYLIFESVSGDCDIYVNGQHLTHHQNSWVPFELDITETCRPEQENTLMIAVKSSHNSAPATEQPMGWSWYGSHYDGIAFPVYLETRSPVYINDVFIQPSLTNGPSLKTEITVKNTTDKKIKTRVSAAVSNEFSHTPKEIILTPHSSQTVTLTEPWPSPQLWWPHCPHLYHITVNLQQDSNIIDAKKVRFGFREVRVDGPNILVNNRKLLHRRASPIIYYPHLQNGKLKAIFKQFKSRGINGLRLHGGAPGMVLDIADEMGILICYESKINEPRGHQVSERFWPRAAKYLADMVKAYRNHPSVIYWAVSNEFGSYYMHGTPEQKKWVDNWLNLMGQQIMRLDPTRTVTYCGDCELGGSRKHGPAPNLNLHYAWQQTKSRSKIPASIYWLEEGGMPWQGIVWDKSKPVLLNEDIYPAYSWNPPWGMTQWSGDRVFDDKGYFQSWFDAIRMLAEGYYHSGVACWNPWATQAGNDKAPLYELGKPMPDFLIATKNWNRTFQSGQKVKRQLFAYNKTLKDYDCQLTSTLTYDNQVIPAFSANFALPGGDFKEFLLALPMPATQERLPVKWHVTLKSNNTILCQRTFSYTVSPNYSPVKLPANTVIVATAKVRNLFTDNSRVVKTLPEALNLNPTNLIMVKPNLSQQDLNRLDQAVRNGLNVLLLEADTESSLPPPLRLAGKHFGSHAFIRTQADPITSQLHEEDLKWWAPDTFVFSKPIFKPSRGKLDILLDTGSPNGLTTTPLIRLYRGKGTYTICQLPLISKFSVDPAAGNLLTILAKSFTKTPEQPQLPLFVLAGKDSPLSKRLTELKIPFSALISSLPNQAILLVDAAEDLTPQHLQLIQSHLKNNGKVVLQRLNSENATTLNQALATDINLQNAIVTNLVRKPDSLLFNSISNDDLCWQKCGNKVWTSSGKKPRKNAPSQVASLLAETTSVIPLTTPAGIAEIKTKNGQLIVCQLRWDDLANNASTKSARFILAFLKNLGADIGNLNLKQRFYTPVNLNKQVNRGFESTANTPAWFGTPDDDMRYFPVNRTGIDPFLNVPQPVVPFPIEPVRLGGIPFKIINPATNNTKSCIILKPEESRTITIPVNAALSRLWLLGALSKVTGKPQTVAELCWQYSDGPTKTTQINSCIQLNGYQYQKSVSKGKIGWIGPTPKSQESVIWVWDNQNPQPKRKVKSITIRLTGKMSLAIIAATTETEK